LWLVLELLVWMEAMVLEPLVGMVPNLVAE
jgi:hypothetical protein